MINRDKRCVYVVPEAFAGGVVVNWLSQHGIDAEVMDGGTNGGFEGVTWLLPGPSYKGIEIWVLNPVDVERAKLLLSDKADEVSALAKQRKARTGTINARCDECGGITIFAATRSGRTESCAHCRAYVDVPDPDADDWRTDGEVEAIE